MKIKKDKFYLGIHANSTHFRKFTARYLCWETETTTFGFLKPIHLWAPAGSGVRMYMFLGLGYSGDAQWAVFMSPPWCLSRVHSSPSSLETLTWGAWVLSTFLTTVRTLQCFSQMLYRCAQKALVHLRQKEKRKKKLMYCTAPCSV